MAKIPSAPQARTFGVVLRAEDRPGIKAVGEFLPGREYQVPAAEAARLTRDKGFRLLNPSDAAAIEAALAPEAATNDAVAAPAAAKVEG